MILVLDFGGQYKELIARAVRGLAVYSEIRSGDITAQEIKDIAPSGIILTGGPSSVYAENAPLCEREIFELGIPVMGICYGFPPPEILAVTSQGAVFNVEYYHMLLLGPDQNSIQLLTCIYHVGLCVFATVMKLILSQE
jgi:carbamoylphosphate synthase small subunit